MLNFVMCTDNVNGLGKNGSIPWKNREDMQFFRKTTTMHPNSILIMGRKTFESIGKPLKGRQSYVVTRQRDWAHDDVHVFNSLTEATQLAKSTMDKIFVIGGAEIYRQCWEDHRLDIETMYITRLDDQFDCDVFFNVSISEILCNYELTETKMIQGGRTMIFKHIRRRKSNE